MRLYPDQFQLGTIMEFLIIQRNPCLSDNFRYCVHAMLAISKSGARKVFYHKIRTLQDFEKSRLKTVQALHLSGFLECDKSKNPVQFCLSLSMKIGLKVMEPKLRLIPGFYLNSYFFQISVMTCDMVTDAYSKTMKTGGPIANEE